MMDGNAETAAGGRDFPFYVGMLLLFNVAQGLFIVIYQWMLLARLQLDAAGVGFAQMLFFLPTLLMPIAGAVADGRLLRPFIARWLCAGLALLCLLAVYFLAGQSRPAFLIALAAGWALIGAFFQPAATALLKPVLSAGADVGRAVALVTGVIFGGQVVGFAIGATLGMTGALPLVVLQIAVLTGALFCLWRIREDASPVTDTDGAAQRRAVVASLIEGFRLIGAQANLGVPILLLGICSLLFSSVLMVGTPLLVREAYQGGAAVLATAPMLFLVGMTLATVALSRLPPIRRPGRVLCLDFLLLVPVVMLLAVAPPLPWFFALVCLWGALVGIGTAVVGGLVQANAPVQARGRVLAVYQFAQVAGAPIGNMAFGTIAAMIGLFATLMWLGLTFGMLCLTFLRFSPLWGMRSEPAPI